MASSPLLTFTTEPAPGKRRLDLHVPGVHCANCIRKVEGAVRPLEGITLARVNFSTRRLAVEWEDAQVTPEAIVEAVEGAGFEARPFNPADAAATEADPQSRRLLTAMAVAGFAAMNIMLLSVSVWSGADGATRHLFHILSAAIAIPAVAYAGRPFFASAWGALRHGRTNMDVPISIGILLATGMSFHEMLTDAPHVWFDAATMLIFFLLVGRYLDSVMRDKARAGVATLMKQAARGALVLGADGTQEYRPIEAVAPGMLVLVAAGERVPVDGVVTEGRSALDSALLTGESLPQAVQPGSLLSAGTLNLDAPLTVKTTAVGEASFLGQVLRMMEAAEGGRARHVRIADRAARLYAPAVHLLALCTFLGWMAAGAGWHQSLLTATAVLIITCPCALGLAVPAVQVTAANLLMQRGVLLKDGGALERLVEADSVLFDKTGTLTLGRPEPAGELPLVEADLARAAGLAARSRHPLSRGLLAAARRQGVVPATLADVREVPGCGMEARVDGVLLRLGRLDWVGAEAGPEGALLSLAFRKGDGAAVVLPFHDPLRPDARAAIDAIRTRGLRVGIVSGDRPEAVDAVARELGIDDWHAAMTPADKLDLIRVRARQGRRVLVVGDGLNDAPALAAGHVSMAPSSASDAGQTAADLLFLQDGLMAVPEALSLATAADRHIRQNFAAAIGYNVLAVPIAIAGFATPMIAAIAMSGSSILVVANALRLRWAVPAKGAR
ncbi:heavy metal translocating P-type ATPase [Sandaracinobacteroides hominis]|uniref:heavy metal translocating P-type ATPase n=1 Tax=Sandaracinobacteroides hominis TaxID=2780086 RepID=UPI0018F68D61|nr:heavy metal translocating P-type ATPase [Sandaracinobacteroides hominis]